MKLLMCAVYDKTVAAFMSPFFVRSKPEAIRSFSDACADEKTQFSRHPEDFVLFYVAEFSDDNGELRLPNAPEKLITALECVAAKQV